MDNFLGLARNIFQPPEASTGCLAPPQLGCLTPSIGRVRVIEKSCVKFWTISQRGGDAARLAVGRADWLGRPASGRVDRAWGDESQVPQTRTPPRTPNARRTSMSWSAIGASPPRGSAWSCAGTATRSRVPARTSRSRRRLHARARAHARTRSTPTLPGWAHAAPHAVPWQVLATRCAGRPARGPASRPCPMASVGCVCTALAALPCAASLPVARLGPVTPHTAFRRVLLHWPLLFGRAPLRHVVARWRLRALGRGLHFAVASAARRGVEWRGAAVASR